MNNTQLETNPTQEQQEFQKQQTDQEIEEDEEEESLSQQLLRHWSNERFSPEILHHQQNLIESILERIQQQSTALNILINNPDGLNNDEEHFQLILIETEIERLRWLTKAYTRTRLYKLDKFFDYCLIDNETKSKLSQIDIEYCQREQTYVHNLLMGSVLDGLPSKYKKLDEDHMIIKPDLDQAVFIIAIKTCGPVYLPNSESIILKKGSRHFLRYRSIKHFLETDQVKLV